MKLPTTEDLDEAIGTSKWMVKKATADALGRGAATALESGKLQLVGPKDGISPNGPAENDVHGGANGLGNGEATAAGGCGNPKLDW